MESKEGEEYSEPLDEILSQLREKIWSGSNSAFVHAPPSESTRFLKPVTDEEVQCAEASCVPNKATNWAVNIWEDWSKNCESLRAQFPNKPLHLLTIEQMNSWLAKFILKVRRKDSNEYQPNTLYQIACGIQ